MTKQIVKVFPDYCSSGVWTSDGCNADPEELGISPGLQLALKYWHEVWEFDIACTCTEEECAADGHRHASPSYVERWVKDGKRLALLMSLENPKYRFVYKG